MSGTDTISDWNPSQAPGPAGNVMPYTAGVAGPGTAEATQSLNGEPNVPGFMSGVTGNTDNGVSHSGGSVDLQGASGS